MTNIPEPLATQLLIEAAKNGLLHIKDEGKSLRVRGQIFLSGPKQGLKLTHEDPNLIQGVALEDIRKGQVGGIIRCLRIKN